MFTNSKTAEPREVKVMLSTLWVFAMLNYLYADVIGLMNPKTQEILTTGEVGATIQITPGFLLAAAILMETAIAMVLLSRLLKYRANRWANIIVAAIHTLSVFASMFIGTTPDLYYLFFGTIEIACTLFIIWYAWQWSDSERESS